MAKNTPAPDNDTAPGTELDTTFRNAIDENMASFDSFEKIAAFFETENGVALFDNATDGVKSLNLIDGQGDNYSKDDLIGIPFVILQWRFNKSDKYEENGRFVAAEITFAVSPEGVPMRKVLPNSQYTMYQGVLNDGGTGIARQLEDITRRRTEKGIANTQEGRGVRKGLRRSEYDFQTPDGLSGRGVTYYLDM